MLDVPTSKCAAGARSSGLTSHDAADGIELAATLFEPAGIAASRRPADRHRLRRRRPEPLLRALRRLPGRPRPSRADLRLSRHRSVAARLAARLAHPHARLVRHRHAGRDRLGRPHLSRPALHWIGHSLGGFATGLAHNNTRIARQLSVATLSGYWGRMSSPERYRVRFLMGSVAPIVVRLAGYFPGWLMGGEDMPGPAFLEWTRWCMEPEFIFGDPTLTEVSIPRPVPRPHPLRPDRGRRLGHAGRRRAPCQPLHRPTSSDRPGASASPMVAASPSATTASSASEFRATLWPAAYAWLAGKRSTWHSPLSPSLRGEGGVRGSTACSAEHRPAATAHPSASSPSDMSGERGHVAASSYGAPPIHATMPACP